MTRFSFRSLLVLSVALLGMGSVHAADSTDALLGVLQKVGPEGKGNQAATDAWQSLANEPPEKLTKILTGLDDANPLAANWIHAAVDAVAERSIKEGRGLPAADLESFVLETRHNPRGRRLAFEWLAKVDPTASDRLIPGMLNDPSTELRRDAVQRLIDQADSLAGRTPEEEKPNRNDDDDAKKEEKKAIDKAEIKNLEKVTQLYRQAMVNARDTDQIKLLATRLRELGETVDLPTHYGFVMDWKLIGPFDHTGSKAFDKPYPPESRIDLTAEYDGKEGKVRWIEHITTDDYGKVDLNTALGKHKGAIAYAFAEFTSDKEQAVEIRLGSITAWKVWLNGELLFGHEEYHSGTRLDQNRLEARLKQGVNTILMKVCQNEQTESWAQEWHFQLRICDEAGTAILSTTRPKPAKSQADKGQASAQD